jgi:hypothetical protein
MKNALYILIPAVVAAIGGGYVANGILTGVELETIGASLTALITTGVAIFLRNRAAAKAAEAYGSSVAAKLIRQGEREREAAGDIGAVSEAQGDTGRSPKNDRNGGSVNWAGLLLIYILPSLFVGSLAVNTGCKSVSPEVKAVATNLFTSLVKAGVKAGINAFAANNPRYADIAGVISAGFEATFSRVDDATPPEELAAAILSGVETAVADPDAQRELLTALVAGIEAATSHTSSPSAAPQGEQATSPTQAAALLAALRR